MIRPEDAWLDGGPIDDDSWLNGGPLGDDDADALAVITGLAPATVALLFEEGAPRSSSEFFGWYMHRATGDEASFDKAKAAKVNAEARLKEMELARLQGGTWTVEEVVALFREESAIVRSQLLAVPGRCAVPLAAESDPALIEAALDLELNAALASITGDRVETWTGESNEARDIREDAEGVEHDHES